MSDDGRTSIWSQRAPLILVAVAVLFNLWVWRDEVKAVEGPNDMGLHMQMVHWAGERIDDGHLPLDGWYPYMQLGSAQFHHYQSTPHVITAYAGQVLGEDTAYRWFEYLLLALWPLSVFAGVRLFGGDPWVAGVAASLSPLLVSDPGYGYESSSYVWRGLGVWPQLWGMVTFPLALGFTWRALKEGRHYAWAAVFVALTIAFNFIAGYLALLLVPVLVLTAPGPWRTRLVRGAAVGIGSLLIASWVLMPLVSDSAWVNSSPFFRDDFWNDSFGAREVLGWLVSGELFDAGRLPIVTLLAGAGAVACVLAVRTQAKARALLAMSMVSLLLFFGRPTLGPLLSLLPGSDDLMFHRFIIGLHMVGLVLAAVGAVALVRLAIQAMDRTQLHQHAVIGVPVVVLAIALVPCFADLAFFGRENGEFIDQQREADATDGADLEALITEIGRRGPGRVYAGLRNNWGANYKVGFTPVYSILATHDLDAVGFTYRTVTGLSTDLEPLFDETDANQYRLFNVRYIIVPADTEPPILTVVPVATSGRHSLYEVVDENGYVEVVDTVGTVEADRTNMAAVMEPYLASVYNQGFPLVSFDGRDAGTPSVERFTFDPGGTVDSEDARLEDGYVAVHLNAAHDAEALLKTTFHPRWTASVDGVAVEPRMVAPSFIGVPVSGGSHDVVFEYESYPWYGLWLLVGAVTIVALAVGPRFIERRRSRKAQPPESVSSSAASSSD